MTDYKTTLEELVEGITSNPTKQKREIAKHQSHKLEQPDKPRSFLIYLLCCCRDKQINE